MAYFRPEIGHFLSGIAYFGSHRHIPELFTLGIANIKTLYRQYYSNLNIFYMKMSVKTCNSQSIMRYYRWQYGKYIEIAIAALYRNV